MNARSHLPRRLAVIGDPIAHSLSPALQNFLIAYFDLPFVYEAVRVSPGELAGFVQKLRAGEYAGVNVTIPHKQAIIPLLDELTAAAAGISAVNTLVPEAGILRGHNTDVPGFLRSVQAAGIRLQNQNVLVLGAGGAAAAVIRAVLDAGANVVYACNRDPSRAEKLCAKYGAGRARSMGLIKWEEREDWLRMQPVTVIVNATSAGMPPQQQLSPLPASAFYPGLTVVDLIYHPRETLLLRDARAAGATALNGLSMLIYQGVAALELWSQRQLEIDDIYAALEKQLTGAPLHKPGRE